MKLQNQGWWTVVTDTGQLGDRFLSISGMLLLVAMLDQRFVFPHLTWLIVNSVALVCVLGLVSLDSIGPLFETRTLSRLVLGLQRELS